ncbi:hypoxanthine phosphoribosyltransferase [Vibrio sp. 404]|uniref:Hypoxanthine phosphoribosyltransferase n=1 Tax=Vibrio marinisediminis TaxID=2758441 RepID=A0A7W2ITV2_9VIBR|nr:phosphoribosyltransferase family protein [Vibrio marinisediminis]MBA5762865.1 hypoxanthine phosphoribosyltransferase [Vibrio marinisediminis]
MRNDSDQKKNSRHNFIGEIVLSTEQVEQGVTHVAQVLNQRFNGEKVVFVSVVPGGILFTADLIRKIDFDVKLDYVSCHHTPGSSTNNSEIIYQQNVSIDGAHVILLDDAIETGGTMKRVAAFFAEQSGVQSVSIACLFVKPGRIDIPFTQFFAYEMENDDMLIGYGLSWQEHLHNLPYVAKLIPEDK